MFCKPKRLAPRYSALLQIRVNWRAGTVCTIALWQGPTRQSGAASVTETEGGREMTDKRQQAGSTMQPSGIAAGGLANIKNIQIYERRCTVTA